MGRRTGRDRSDRTLSPLGPVTQRAGPGVNMRRRVEVRSASDEGFRAGIHHKKPLPSALGLRLFC
jgi:hypothetical protein